MLSYSIVYNFDKIKRVFNISEGKLLLIEIINL